jgi:hypothetical protein
MISGAGATDNDWLVILPLMAKQHYTDSGDPGWLYQSQTSSTSSPGKKSVDIKKPLTFVRGLIPFVTLS